MRKLTHKQVLGIAFSVFVTLAVTCFFVFRSWQDNSELHTNQRKIAQADEKMGIMAASEDLKIDNVVAKVQQNGSISESDLSWILALLKRNDKAGPSQEIARASILVPVEELKTISPPQEERIYQAVVPMLRDSPAYNDDLDKIRASAVMKTLRDQRAVSYLVPLLTVPDHTVHQQIHLHAQEALSAIGNKV